MEILSIKSVPHLARKLQTIKEIHGESRCLTYITKYSNNQLRRLSTLQGGLHMSHGVSGLSRV